jgi:hypothetical protein
MPAFNRLALALASTTLALSAAAIAKQSDDFQSLADLDKCVSRTYDSSHCLDRLEKFAKKNPKDQFEIGKRARLQFAHWVALRFFEPAMQKPTAAQCADEDVGLAVRSGLALPPDRPPFEVAKKLFTGSCFNALKPVIEKEITADKGVGYLSTNTCPILAGKGVKLDACQPKAAEVPAPAPVEKLPEVNIATAKIGLAKVYSGPEGERVVIADVADTPGAYLIRVDNVRSPINGKTRVHKESDQGRRTEFWTQHEGGRWNTVVVTNNGSYKDYNVYVPGLKNGLRVSYDDAETKKFKADDLKK